MVVIGEDAVAYSSNGSVVCNLPKPNAHHALHSQNGLTLCGGTDQNIDYDDEDYVQDECLVLENGGWSVSHTLSQLREGHVSWKSPKGIMLMNGCCKFKDIGSGCGPCNKTVELLKDDGTSEEPFKMTYDFLV
mgnify:CR=1 FL=1